MRPKHYYLIFVLLLFSQKILAQYHETGDKVLFDEKGKIVRKERKADYYRVYNGQDGSGFYYVEDFFIDGKKQFSGKVKSSNSECWSYCTFDGLNIWYDYQGKVSDYKFYSDGSLWNGFHSYNLGSKHYEATFTNGKITTVHKEEAIVDNSFSDNLKTAVVGGAVLYGLYKLFSGGSSSSSSSDNSSSETKHTWTCSSNGIMITIRQNGSSYYIGDEYFSSWSDAKKRACIKTNCNNCN